MKIKPKKDKNMKKLDKFKKFVKMANAKNVYFLLIDDVLYVENRKQKTKNALPDEMQKEDIKEFIMAVQNGTEKEYIQKLADKLKEEKENGEDVGTNN